MMRPQSIVLTATLAIATIAIAPRSAPAAAVDLSAALGNSGYEDDLTHSQWSDTRPNASYLVSVPVNPVITPLDPAFSDGTTLPALTAPDGANFIGVLNPTEDDDIKGKLAHNALAQSFAADTEFQVLVWGNRGRLGSNNNTNSDLSTVSDAGRPKLFVQFLGWGAGALPTVNSSDDWSRNPLVNISLEFTDWAAVTEWSDQLFSFSPGVALEYIALAVSGRNNNHDQYVAWDIGEVPEETTLVPTPTGAAMLGVAMLAALGRRRRI